MARGISNRPAGNGNASLDLRRTDRSAGQRHFGSLSLPPEVDRIPIWGACMCASDAFDYEFYYFLVCIDRRTVRASEDKLCRIILTFASGGKVLLAPSNMYFAQVYVRVRSLGSM